MSTETATHPIAERAMRELDSQAIRSLVGEIGLPACPRLLLKMHRELDREQPKLHRLERVVNEDPTLAPILLRTANSSLFALMRKAETVEQAFMILGLINCQSLFNEILLRRLLPADSPAMDRFWNVASKRTRAMTFIARTRRIVPPAMAHTCGLFLDVGIPLLARKFPGPDGYLKTLAEANESLEPFTRIERRMHVLDHTVVGAIAARAWGVAQTVVLAVRLHHEYATWTSQLPAQVAELLGLALVSDHIVARYEEVERHLEWDKGGRLALHMLGIDEPVMYEWCDEVHHHFDAIGRDKNQDF
jgi:HD-like signal output (HDOD) protein